MKLTTRFKMTPRLPGALWTSFRPLAALVSGCVLAFAALCALPAGAVAEPATPAEPSGAGSVQTAITAHAFTDIHGDEEFAEAVSALAEKGIVAGRQDGSFGPEESLTRAQMAVFLARALGLPESPGQPFFDVNMSDWFAGAVGALYQKGLIQGTSPIMFSPNQAITRQQAISLVMRSLGFHLKSDPASGVPGPELEFELPKDEAPDWLAGFRDRPLIAPAHTISVANAYRLGVLDSPADGWLLPGFSLNRAQMAMMLYRAFLQPIEARTAYPMELPAVSTYAPQSVGSDGSLVSLLEITLTALHYPCGPVDGVYDYRTKNAVMAFEKVERLKRDGKVAAEVWQQLLSARTPTPRLSAAGTRCEVDLTRQVLFMITDNKVWKVVHVSTGRLGTRTGHFSIGAKYEGWVKLVTLDGYFYYPSYVVSKTAIHGYESVPPYPASHGCVRVPMWMAKELYFQLPKGTPVDIFY